MVRLEARQSDLQLTICDRNARLTRRHWDLREPSLPPVRWHVRCAHLPQNSLPELNFRIRVCVAREAGAKTLLKGTWSGNVCVGVALPALSNLRESMPSHQAFIRMRPHLARSARGRRYEP